MRNEAKIKTHYTEAFKHKVAIEALKGRETLGVLSVKYAVAVPQISAWKKQLEEESVAIFKRKNKKQVVDPLEDTQKLHELIGKLKVENDFLSGFLNKCR